MVTDYCFISMLQGTVSFMLGRRMQPAAGETRSSQLTDCCGPFAGPGHVDIAQTLSVKVQQVLCSICCLVYYISNERPRHLNLRCAALAFVLQRHAGFSTPHADTTCSFLAQHLGDFHDITV